MMTWYARNDVPYSGGEKQLSITFPYIKKEHIKVFVNDVETTEYHFLNESQIFLDCELNTGDIMSVRRDTPIDELMVTFTDTSIVSAEKQNLAQKQVLNSVQEIYDNNIQFQIDTDEAIETNKQEVLEIQENFKQEVYQIVDTVKDAAEKINQLEQAVDTAVTAADTASQKADDIEQFVTEAEQSFNTNIQEALSESQDLLQEARDVLADTLTTSQITNCITEIPQRIKLELNNGTLTLKAGSEVIIPNGFEADGVTPKFDYVTINEDNPMTLTAAETRLPVMNPSGIISSANVSRCSSGNTRPTGDGRRIFYNATTNLVEKTEDGGSTWTSGYSLPFCVFTGSTTGIKSLDQVFNGMGYIGSTVWVDKGVKGLIPNGRNADGTLRNIEWQNSQLKTFYAYVGDSSPRVLTFRYDGETLNYTTSFSSSNCANPVASYYFQQPDYPVFSDNVHVMWFNTTENRIYTKKDNVSELTDEDDIVVLGYEISNGSAISSMVAKDTFRAVDYNDKYKISGWGMPSTKSTNLALGASGSTYIAPANGWFYIWMSFSTQKPSLTLRNTSVGVGYQMHGYEAGGYELSVPCITGQQILINYSGTSDGNNLKFIYAEGDQ